MPKIIKLRSRELFPTYRGDLIPKNIYVLADQCDTEADIDVVIGTYNQPREVNAAIENYLALEKQARLHIWVVDDSHRPWAFTGIKKDPRVSRVLILNKVRATDRRYAGNNWASNGASVAAQIGMNLGTARYGFFSHTDMMGYKENFLSYLLSKMDADTPVAAFTQRHVFPFTGGMLYDKRNFAGLAVDWMPKQDNHYVIPGLEPFRDQVSHYASIDSGEQIPLEAFQRGQKAYICASRGITGDYLGDPLNGYDFTKQAVMAAGAPVHFAPLNTDAEQFARRYPELATPYNAMWRKSFDEDGAVIFIHRGRGTTNRNQDDKRGDFFAFVEAFNARMGAAA
ncbi:MAG: hypothetical protein JXB38_19915 [Anaerolineales bacterium]|nr:hypothetical protein [Anaerolineales bacterium]